MKIRSLRLRNFRGYKDFDINFSANLNVIIGKNDIGKSTILEALDIFFNSEKIKMELDDLCVYKTSNEIEISICFEVDINKEYLIETVPTSLSKEYLLNKDGLLEICKKWECSNTRLSTPKIFLKANYPLQFLENPLVGLKNTDLKKLYKLLEIEIKKADIEVRLTTNTEIRKAIYEVSNISDYEEIFIPIDKEDGKDIWNSINTDLPLYFLFQADRANKDTDKEVQDPLKAITKTAINEVLEELEKVKELVKKKAELIGIETINKLSEINSELASVLNPEVSTKAWESLFSFEFIGNDNIPINKRGSGVRRMILLSYFRAEAERQNANNKNIIYAIEEPETSQHPNHQQLLVSALKDIATKETHTVIITTHSPEIAKRCKSENLILIDNSEGNKILVKEEFKLKAIADTLGVVAYLGKLVICVEGDNDRKFLYNINQNIPELKNIIDLKRMDINIIPMEGRNLEDWIKHNYLEGSNVLQFHLYDRDGDEKYKKSIEIVNNRDDDSYGVLTKMLEMENYIHFCLYEVEYKGLNLSSIINNWKDVSIPRSIFDFLEKTDRVPEKFNGDINAHQEKAKYTKRQINRIKSQANGVLARKMTKDLFEDMGVYEEVEGWFKKIKTMYEI